MVDLVIAAPEALRLEQRTGFRREATALLDRLAPGRGTLVIDLGATRAVDSAGLGALIVIHRQAAARRVDVRLVRVSEEIRFLLRLTKLDELFELDMPGTAGSS